MLKATGCVEHAITQAGFVCYGAPPLVKPHQLHFVAGQSLDGKFEGHAVGVGINTDSNFRFAVEDRPHYDQVRADMIARDWAIITLAEVLTLKPILWRSIRNADLPSAAEPGEIARAGYSQDRPFLLSMHRGCFVKTDVPQPGSVLHQCDSMPGIQVRPYCCSTARMLV
jgi:hypothetical protein